MRSLQNNERSVTTVADAALFQMPTFLRRSDRERHNNTSRGVLPFLQRQDSSMADHHSDAAVVGGDSEKVREATLAAPAEARTRSASIDTTTIPDTSSEQQKRQLDLFRSYYTLYHHYCHQHQQQHVPVPTSTSDHEDDEPHQNAGTTKLRLVCHNIGPRAAISKSMMFLFNMARHNILS